MHKVIMAPDVGAFPAHIVSGGKLETCLHEQTMEFFEHCSQSNKFFEYCIFGWNCSQHGNLIISEWHITKSA